jgi:Na+/H+ antiporter NhaD/arsenite permease-like protein
MEVANIASITTVFFLLGYCAIIFDKFFKVDKTAIALFMGIGCWILYFAFAAGAPDEKLHLLNEHLAQISQILLFLMGAMLIVEVIEAHEGLDVFGRLIRFESPKLVLWALLGLSFFLSALLDNLTTMIVFICLLRKLIPDKKHRVLFLGAIVVSANIGGVWTPIGDVTTTMLWIGNRITTFSVINALFIPCALSLLVLGAMMSFRIPSKINFSPLAENDKRIVGKRRVLLIGVATFFLAPILKMAIDLPPFMGIMLGVAILWLVTDIAHYRDSTREHLRVFHVLGRIDMSSVLFFLGILLAIDSLEVVGVLKSTVDGIESLTTSPEIIAGTIGAVSSILDNVPLVAACMRMYGLETFPTDSYFWNLIAYCAGTGGSILLIGSAPGIALMSMEKVSFSWYFKHIAWISLVTYFVGLLYYVYVPIH